MDMDSSSWLGHGYAATNNAGGNNGFMCGYAAGSCSPADLQYMEDERQQQFLISSQFQHHINQISMRMNMDDEAAAVYMSSNDGGAAAATTIDMHDPIVEGLLDDAHHAGTCSFPSSSSSSSLSLPACSASLSCSPESSSVQHFLATPAAAAGGCNQQYPEVSSHVPLLSPPPPPPVMPSYGHQYTNLQAPESSPAKTTTGAFKHYTRHLGPKRLPAHGACGQRMFKTAMSVLSKMHEAARYSQQQYYYQAAAAAAADAVVQPPSVNQLQHMFSERKRREKLNDSFHALKAVLPPGSKKDKTSILIRAREYVRSLEAKVAELEEKNKSLESRLTRHNRRRKSGGSGGDDDDHDSGETTKVQVEITKAANEGLCTLKIAVWSPLSAAAPNMTDVVVRTLQCLKEHIGDGVSLVAMSTSGGGAGPATRAKNASTRAAVLTMQIKSPGTDDWEEQPVKDAVAKVVADALTTTTTTPPPAATSATSGFGEASQLIIS